MSLIICTFFKMWRGNLRKFDRTAFNILEDLLHKSSEHIKLDKESEAL